MIIKDVATLEPIRAGDGTELREILHPGRDGVPRGYSLAHALLEPDRASLPHRLASTEVYYILYGTGVMHIDDDEERIHAGQSICVPPGGVQWIENTGAIDLAFLCIVDPPWRAEDEEVLE